MSVYEITFSPTGRTKKVSDAVVRGFGQEKQEINLLKKDTEYDKIFLKEEDLCVIAVPSYGGRVPETAAYRLGQLQGNGAKAVLIVTYGNRAYDDTLLELKNSLTAAGFLPVAAIAAVTEHSILRQFATGRPDERDECELLAFAERIRKKLEEGIAHELAVPGKMPYKELHGFATKPETLTTCTECGFCAGECPVGAISLEKPSQTDWKKCIACMRCISVCPSHAREVGQEKLRPLAERLEPICGIRKENELFL